MSAVKQTTRTIHASSDSAQKRHPQQKRKPEELSPTTLRSQRLALELSQSELGRQSGVSRPKICIYELGGTALNAQEQRLIQQALQREAQRLRNISLQIDFGQAESLPAQVIAGPGGVSAFVEAAPSRGGGPL